MSSHSREFDIVTTLGREAFLELHPRNGWPVWMETFRNVWGCEAQRVSPNKWTYLISLPLGGPLKPNESWEEINGRKVLTSIDPETGQKMIVISRAAIETIVLFEALVDLELQAVNIVQDKDLSEISLPLNAERDTIGL